MNRRITVVGAGAIGGVVGASLADAGHETLLVDVVAEHVDAINREGLRITGCRGDRRFAVRAVTPDRLEGPLGLVLLAVKAQHTRDALAVIAPRLAPDGAVVSLQNGLCEEIIAAAVGRERTVGAFVHFGADYTEPGQIMLSHEVPIRLGELDGSINPRLTEVAGVLAAAMPVAITRNVWGYLWGKLCYGVMAFAGALVDHPFGETCGTAWAQPVLLETAREAARVATALGIELQPIDGFDPSLLLREDDGPARQMLNALAEAGRKNLKQYTGIQRDILVRRRPTEVDYQPGAVAAKGAEVGVPTPLCADVVRMIKEIETGARRPGWPNLEELAGRRNR